MNILDTFINYLCGDFDNHEQYEAVASSHFPLATHINRQCHDKIENLPEDFKGYFIIEESYYEINDKTKYLPHLFLFTLNKEEKVVLTSYDLPQHIPEKAFKYNHPDLMMDYTKLQPSTKFNPMVYTQEGDFFKGKSVSDFGKGLIFTLEEETGPDTLIVKESFFREGQMIFGFDRPLIYKRKLTSS